MDVLGDDVCILGLVVAAGRAGGGGEGEGPVCVWEQGGGVCACVWDGECAEWGGGPWGWGS